MRKSKDVKGDPDLLAEYDFRGGVRGKYAERFASGTNLVLLEPDVARSFPDARTVNEALRALLRLQDSLRDLHNPREPTR
jgi:hypothetical protein